jgi:hypothetical protein
MADYFPSAGKPAFTSRNKIVGPHHPPLRSGRFRFAPRCRSGPPDGFRRHEGRDGRGRSEHKEAVMTTDDDITGYEPPQASSPTDHLLTELQLYGHRSFQDEPDPRPLPDPRIAAGAVADIFDALIVSFDDTRLEPDLDDLLWSTVNLFHRATERIARHLDDNEQAQRRGQREQDGRSNWNASSPRA